MRKRFELAEAARCGSPPFLAASADCMSADAADSYGTHGKKSKKTVPDRLYLNLRTVYY